MMQQHNKPGYVLITTLFLLTGLSMIVVSLLQNVWTAQRFSRFAEDRIQAYALAHSGFEIAKSQIARPSQPQQDANGQNGQNKGQQSTPYFVHILPYINRWQEFQLTQEHDGVDGTIYTYIAPEAGKVPLPALFDRENKQLTEQARNTMQQLSAQFEKFGLSSQLPTGFEEIAQDPPYFDDPSQVIPLHNAFATFDQRRFISFIPETQPLQNRQLPVLYDLFTVFGNNSDALSFHPLLFSRSVCALFGCNPLPQDAQSREQAVEKIKEQMPQQFDWQRDWDTLLAPFYGISYAELSDSLRSAFSTERSANYFSVVSYAYVRDSRVYLYAMIERVEDNDSDSFRIHRMYWI